MTWNPPAAPLLPPPSVPSSTQPAPEPESPSEREAYSAASAAAWIGLLGAALVLTASAVVLTRSWPGYGELIRAVALIAGAAIATLVAERFRTSVPVTAQIDAHVGALLAGAAGMAATSLAGAEWPLCLVVGGAAAVAATEYQSGRWNRATMLAGQVIAICLAATGTGALTAATPALLAALVSVAYAALGRNREAVALATIAVLSPLLEISARLGYGPGTLDRAGLTGGRLDWSRPTVGLVAGAVFLAIARRTADRRWYVAAVVAPLWSGFDSVVDLVDWVGGWLERYDVTAADCSIAVMSLILLAIGLVARRLGTPSSWVAYSPALVLAGPWLVLTVAGRNPGWAIPTALTIGIVAAGLGAWFRLGAPLVGGTAITTLTVVVASWGALEGTPSWAWLALGGAGLLTLAVMIERRGVPSTAGLKALTDRWS